MQNKDNKKEISQNTQENNEVKNNEIEDNHHSELFVFKVISFVLGFMIIVGIVVVLKYGNFNGISQKELQSKYIQKDIISFSDLPNSEQQKYILKSKQKKSNCNKYITKISKLTTQIKTLESNTSNSLNNDILQTYKKRVKKLELELYSYKQASIEQTQKIDLIKTKDEEIKLLKNRLIALKESMKILPSNTTKLNTISKYIHKKQTSSKKTDINLKTYLNKKNKKQPKQINKKASNNKIATPTKTEKEKAFNINYYGKNGPKIKNPYTNITVSLKKRLYCKRYDIGSYEIPKTCMNEFKKFITSAKKSSLFEIIPVIDTKDSNYIKRHIKSEKFEKFSEMGLGKLRSNEIGWNIKKLLGDDVNLKYVPYNAYTKKIRRGVIIKVYN